MRYVIFVAFAILICGAIIPVKAQLLASSVRVPCDQVGAVAAAIRVVLDGISEITVFIELILYINWLIATFQIHNSCHR